VSAGPSAPYGTTRVTGRDGQDCAAAPIHLSVTAAAAIQAATPIVVSSERATD
jgi:hypothetical protein